jgi:hypothetical protein
VMLWAQNCTYWILMDISKSGTLVALYGTISLYGSNVW